MLLFLFISKKLYTSVRGLQSMKWGDSGIFRCDVTFLRFPRDLGGPEDRVWRVGRG